MLIEFILDHVFNDIKVDNVVAGITIWRVISSGFKRVGMSRWAQVTPGFYRNPKKPDEIIERSYPW